MNATSSPATEYRSSAPVLLTISAAAELLSVSRSTAYRLIANGELEVVRIGRSARVPRAAVVDLVEKLRAGTRY